MQHTLKRNNLDYHKKDKMTYTSDPLVDRHQVQTLKGNFVEIFKVSVQGQIQRGAIGAIAPLKSTKVTSFTMLLQNSKKSINDIRPFCHSLLCP